ncbi:aminotransferase family protein [Patulibacter defluvii]|uniref:aminotransferase family protein n=1 Tax=Patulibacter defluvii TaxID=3095358 RepID=UPI002A760D5C|nr:aminotransferase class III-fold pyridoxal phosphate-dependent enzyme [Patulibacter sp. DM4]
MTAAPTGTRLWHPFADMSAVDGHEFVVARGEGAWIWDRDGRRYLDGTAALWYANVGHGRPEIADAVAAQLRTLDAYGAFGDFANQPAIAVAERLAELAPVDDARVFLTTGGGEAIDTAVKLARRWWHAVGEPQRTWVISRENGYHGTNGYGTSIGGLAPNRAELGPLIEDTARVSHDDVSALAATIERLGADRVAAFVCEPVIGAGGVHLPAPGYLEEAAALCRRHGILFVADSVISAFGRLGSWFGVERWNLRPDMITFAKGVTSGTLPLGGVVVSGRIAEPFWTTPGLIFRHGATYAAHPTCCAAALANLDLLESEGLIARGQELEGPLADVLAPLAEHPAVGEIRSGIGLIAAVELDGELRRRDPGVVGRAAALARDAGLITRALPTALALSPPLVVTAEELAEAAAMLTQALDRLVAA